MAVSGICSSFKSELLNGAHVFDSPDWVTASAASGAYVVTSVSSMIGIAVGMGVSGPGIQAGTVVAATSSTGFTLSLPTTAAIAAGTLNFTADTFQMCLLIAAPSVTYGPTLTNYAAIGADEVPAGSGYVTGGVVLTDVSAVTSGTTAYITFGANPTWPSATFSTSAAVIYNASARLSGRSGRTVAVFDLGGVQSISAGSFVLALPPASPTTALIRLA